MTHTFQFDLGSGEAELFLVNSVQISAI